MVVCTAEAAAPGGRARGVVMVQPDMLTGCDTKLQLVI